jgi:hypothetical protein
LVTDTGKIETEGLAFGKRALHSLWEAVPMPLFAGETAKQKPVVRWCGGAHESLERAKDVATQRSALALSVKGSVADSGGPNSTRTGVVSLRKQRK